MKLGKELKWNNDKIKLSSVVKGFDVFLCIEPTPKKPDYILTFTFDALAPDQVDIVDQTIRLSLKKDKGIIQKISKQNLVITINNRMFGIKAKFIKMIVEKIIANLLKLRVTPQTSCIICGEKHTDDVLIKDSIPYRVHKKCLNKPVEEGKLKLKKIKGQKPKKSATLGAFVGLLPLFLLIEEPNSFYTGLLAFTAVASYLFTFLLGRKLNKHTKFTVFYRTIIASFLMNIFVIIYILLLPIINDINDEIPISLIIRSLNQIIPATGYTEQGLATLFFDNLEITYIYTLPSAVIMFIVIFSLERAKMKKIAKKKMDN